MFETRPQSYVSILSSLQLPRFAMRHILSRWFNYDLAQVWPFNSRLSPFENSPERQANKKRRRSSVSSHSGDSNATSAPPPRKKQCRRPLPPRRHRSEADLQDALQFHLKRKSAAPAAPDRAVASMPVDLLKAKKLAEDAENAPPSEPNSDNKEQCLRGSQKAKIRGELRDGGLIRDYPVLDFVRRVWGFQPDDIPEGRTGYCLHGKLYEDYEKSEHLKTCHYTHGEHTSVVAHYNIMSLLLKIVEVNQQETQSPDIVHPLVKHCRYKLNHSNTIPSYAWHLSAPEQNTTGNVYDEDLAVIGSQADKTKVEPKLRGDVLIRPDLLQELKDHNEALKTFNTHDATTNQTLELATARYDTPDSLTADELQIVYYLKSILQSESIRQYASGFLVEDQWISLWYADRKGVIKSSAFNWIEEPHFHLLMIGAIYFADRRKLGWSPFIHLDPEAPLDDPYRDATLHIPSHTDSKLRAKPEDYMAPVDISGKTIEDRLVFSVDITSQRRLVTSYGLVGRGTTVVPIKVAGDRITAKSIRMEEDPEFPLVAKIQWQQKKWKEDAHLRHIRQTLNSANDPTSLSILKHIVDMKCSLTLSIDSSDVRLPRAFMSALPSVDPAALREFRLLVMEAYEPLARITNVADFKKVFREAFQGMSCYYGNVLAFADQSMKCAAHHWVWVKAEVLHRDISVNNIMFRRRDNTVEGVLCDWDLAGTKADIGEPDDPCIITKKDLRDWDDPPDQESIDALEQRKRRLRIGTPAFMALDLLRHSDYPPVHQYRFDLQSFLFVLCWVCATHNPETGLMRTIPEWNDGNWQDIYHEKRFFLYHGASCRHFLLRTAHTLYKPLFRTWVMRLLLMFRREYVISLDFSDLRCKLIDAIRDNETDKIEPLRAALLEKAKEKEDSVTYEKFLAVLM
ncbi:hypothetical protein K474DRAFT_1329527 [Panus rudis PR-1116 ss-1]|nr:hypothetical protein K474DRAFT_1329527 [Panus rudis PR-1116 ss-1]